MTTEGILRETFKSGEKSGQRDISVVMKERAVKGYGFDVSSVCVCVCVCMCVCVCVYVCACVSAALSDLYVYSTCILV